MSELDAVEAVVAKDLERWRLTVARQCVHEVWLQAAKSGRKSVDKEDDFEDGSAALAIQRRESEIHGAYTRYLQAHLDQLDRRLRELDGTDPG